MDKIKVGDVVTFRGAPLHSSRDGDLGTAVMGKLRRGTIGIVQHISAQPEPWRAVWIHFPHRLAPNRRYCMFYNRLKKLHLRGR